MEFFSEEARIYCLDESGKTLAEVTFPSSGRVADITHTFVDDSLRGQGIAGQLMEKTAEQLRARGMKAKLTCPYAVTWFRQNPQYQDLFYWSCGETSGLSDVSWNDPKRGE